MIYNKKAFIRSMGDKLHGCIPMFAGTVALILLIVFFGSENSGISEGADNSSFPDNSDLFNDRDMQIGLASPSSVPNGTSPKSNTPDFSNEGDSLCLREVFVYITGEVNSPGLFTLQVGSIVADAVSLAGGFTSEADDTSINMVHTIEENTMIVVRQRSELSDFKASILTEHGGDESGVLLLDINSASLSELTLLDGIGPALAARIIDYRNVNGPFTSVDDLLNVSGIGKSKFSSIKENICVRQ